MQKLTRQQAGLLGHYRQNPHQVDPSKLEEMADQLLGLSAAKSGRKRKQERPVLTRRQLATRAATELPVGDLVEVFTRNPSGQYCWLGKLTPGGLTTASDVDPDMAEVVASPRVKVVSTGSPAGSRGFRIHRRAAA